MMGVGFLDAFATCRSLKYFIPRSPEDRSGQTKEFGVVVGDEYLSRMIYNSYPLCKSL
jgi:hypothetical protein